MGVGCSSIRQCSLQGVKDGKQGIIGFRFLPVARCCCWVVLYCMLGEFGVCCDQTLHFCPLLTGDGNLKTVLRLLLVFCLAHGSCVGTCAGNCRWGGGGGGGWRRQHLKTALLKYTVAALFALHGWDTVKVDVCTARNAFVRVVKTDLATHAAVAWCVGFARCTLRWAAASCTRFAEYRWGGSPSVALHSSSRMWRSPRHVFCSEVTGP